MSRIKLSSKALTEAANCLKVLAHPVRLQIIQLLLAKEVTVGEIAQHCGIAQNAASTHLKLLERCGLLSSKRLGRSIIYEVIEKHLKDIMSCIEKRFS